MWLVMFVRAMSENDDVGAICIRVTTDKLYSNVYEIGKQWRTCNGTRESSVVVHGMLLM